MKNLLILILASFLVFACSKNSGGGRGGNNSFGPGKNSGPGGNAPGNPNNTGTGRGEICTFVDKNICVEFTGASWTSQGIQNICVYYQGTVNTGSCQTSGIVGECILNKGFENEAVMKYYSPITRGAASADCDQANGIFQ